MTAAGSSEGQGEGLDDLLAIASGAAELAKPGEMIEAYAMRARQTEVRAYEGEVESLSSSDSAGIGIRVVVGGCQGFAHAASLDAEVVKETLAEARDNASFATPDEHVTLAVPDGVHAGALDLFDEGLTELQMDEKVRMAIELERMVRDGDPRVRQVPSADYEDASLQAAVVTSTGIQAATRRTGCHLSVSAIAGELGGSHTGVGFSVGRGPGDLSPERAAADAIERATRLLGAKKARSGSLVVVFDPRVVSTILGVLSAAFSGEAVTKGRSLFAGRVGEQVALGSVTIVDDPTDIRAYGASPYDAEGLASRRNLLVKDGILQGFVFDTVSARRAGVASTASAVRGGYASTPVAGCRALSLMPGSLDAEAILREVGEGLYVQSVTGVHSGVNPVSGDFSVGAVGLMVSGGELAQPVREVTVASTLQRMLTSVVAIGSDVEWLPGIAAGQTLAIGGMTLSGT